MRLNFRRSNLLVSTALAGLVTFGVGGGARAADPTYQFDIPAEPLSQALTDFSQASSQQIIYSEDLVRGRKSPGLHGRYTPANALGALLSGTNLRIETNSAGVLMVQPKNVQAASNEGAANVPTSKVETVVVTGSLIPGAVPASPVETITAADIRATGYATVADVLKALPQNFGGGINTGLSSNDFSQQAAFNPSQSDAADLRGLGADATLTLLDGRRMSFGDIGNGVDLGLVPTGAIDRIEILTDGASALYGSDAVAGVVNVILKSNYDGAETSGRISGTSDGGGAERQFNQVFGKTWDSGHALFAFENYHLDPIAMDQRSYTSSTARSIDLLSVANRNSYLATVNQNITEDIEAFGSFDYTARSSFLRQNFNGLPSGIETNDSHVSEFALTGGLNIQLPGNWLGTLSATYASNLNKYLTLVPAYGLNLDYSFANHLVDVDARFSGTLFTLASGDVDLAIGGGYRTETLSAPVYSVRGGRDIYDFYGEVRAPLVSESSTRVGLERLELSVSGRFEHYSDFGGVTTPKVGIIYYPFADLKLRGTWGQSFKAPTLREELSPDQVYLYSATDAGETGMPPGSNILYISGARPLKPETSDNWTLGADYTPAQIEGLSLNITGYSIDYQNRLVVPITNITGVFDRTDLAPFITQFPTVAQVNAALALGPVLNLSGNPLDPATTVGIYDDRYTNAVSQKIDGIDLSASYAMQSDLGAFTFSGAGSYLHITEQDSIAAPVKTTTGTIYNPARFKARGTAQWSDGQWSVNAAVNYVSSEIDDSYLYRVEPVASNVGISSWTTIDAQVAYTTPSDAGFLSGFRLALSASNLFDVNPPFAATAGQTDYQTGYDSANANPIGRRIALTLTKDW